METQEIKNLRGQNVALALAVQSFLDGVWTPEAIAQARAALDGQQPGWNRVDDQPSAWRVVMPNGKERGLYSDWEGVQTATLGLEGDKIVPLFEHPAAVNDGVQRKPVAWYRLAKKDAEGNESANGKFTGKIFEVNPHVVGWAQYKWIAVYE